MLELPSQERMNDLLLELMLGVNALAFKVLGNKVLEGPFKGMQVPERAPWNDGNASTKLLGSYEFELHGVVETALARDPRSIVNMGAAEGYYAIGLARRAENATICAVEVNEYSRELCEEYAVRNGVDDRIFTERSIVWKGADLCVVDIEGAELELFDGKGEHFAQTDMIIECHDFMQPGTSEKLVREFLGTHDVEVIEPRLPPFGSYPILEKFPTALTVLIVAEKRPMPTRWIACWSKEKGHSNGEYRSFRRAEDA